MPMPLARASEQTLLAIATSATPCPALFLNNVIWERDPRSKAPLHRIEEISLNRRVGRLPLFEKPADYLAFENILREAYERTGVRISAYCLMPNHWHLLLWPREDGELSEVMRLDHRDPYATLACASPLSRHRPRLSRTIQIVSGSN